MSTGFPVLLYHSVSDRPPPDGAWGAVSPAAFSEHVEAIVAAGREAIDITWLAAGLRGERPLPDRPVAITFDDGYSDTYEAVELLRGRDLVSTVYVTTGAIGAPARLSRVQITALAGISGVELGAHSVRHCRLDELDDSELSDELCGSRSQLEELTGHPVQSFAYPYGAYDRRTRDAVVASGYRSAAAVKNAVSHRHDDPFAIARWTVTAATSAKRIAELLEGEQVALGRTREQLRTRAYRAARRRRRRLFGASGTA